MSTTPIIPLPPRRHPHRFRRFSSCPDVFRHYTNIRQCNVAFLHHMQPSPLLLVLYLVLLVRYKANTLTLTLAHSTNNHRDTCLLLLIIKLFPLCTKQLPNLTWNVLVNTQDASSENDSPKPASGFSVLIRSRQSWLKNMYADRARFGALGSFLDLARGAFSAFSAALRCREVSIVGGAGGGKVMTTMKAMGEV